MRLVRSGVFPEEGIAIRLHIGFWRVGEGVGATPGTVNSIVVNWVAVIETVFDSDH